MSFHSFELVVLGDEVGWSGMQGKVRAEAEAGGVKPACLSTENTDRGSMVEDFFAVVKGGSSESVTALVAKKLPTPKLMNLWGDAVNFNPDFIRTTVSQLVFVVSKCVSLRPTLTHIRCLSCHTSWGVYCSLERTVVRGFVTVPPGLAHWQEAKCSSSSIDQVQKQTV